MWKVKISDSYNPYKFTDKFILDVLTWASIHRYKNNKEQVLNSISNPNLKKVAEIYDTTLIPHMITLSKYKDIRKLRKTYNKFRKKYRAIIRGDIKKPNLDVSDDVKKAFKYFYDSLIDRKRFWEVYNPTETFMKKQEFRDKLGEKIKVCPYCDRSDINVSCLSHTDHFLPFDVFPFISIFWMNLIVSCSSCNGTLIKKDNYRLPILHPYFNNIQDILQFTFNSDKKNIGIEIVNREFEEKAYNYIKTIKLDVTYEKLWGIVEGENSNIWHFIQSSYHKYKHGIQSGELHKIKRIKTIGLRAKRQDISRKIRQEPYTKLKVDYCNHLISTDNEIYEAMITREVNKSIQQKERLSLILEGK